MNYIIAADEVGRGCLAGPLCVGAVFVPADLSCIEGAADSKRLTASVREAVAGRIRSTAGVHYCTSMVAASAIDRDGMARALRGAFQAAVTQLLTECVPDNGTAEVRIDGKPIPGLAFDRAPVQFIVKGDALDWRIGAASIIAKVERDQWMVRAAKQHPAYGWERNKGYGSKEHTDAISRLGLTPLHRATFCRQFIPDDDDGVLDLFD